MFKSSFPIKRNVMEFIIYISKQRVHALIKFILKVYFCVLIILVDAKFVNHFFQGLAVEVLYIRVHHEKEEISDIFWIFAQIKVRLYRFFKKKLIVVVIVVRDLFHGVDHFLDKLQRRREGLWIIVHEESEINVEKASLVIDHDVVQVSVT